MYILKHPPSKCRGSCVTCLWQVYWQPSDPLQLWNNHQSALIEDFGHDHPQDITVNRALHEIHPALQENGSSCTMIGLPEQVGNDLLAMNNHQANRFIQTSTTSMWSSEICWEQYCMLFLRAVRKGMNRNKLLLCWCSWRMWEDLPLQQVDQLPQELQHSGCLARLSAVSWS